MISTCFTQKAESFIGQPTQGINDNQLPSLGESKTWLPLGEEFFQWSEFDQILIRKFNSILHGPQDKSVRGGGMLHIHGVLCSVIFANPLSSEMY